MNIQQILLTTATILLLKPPPSELNISRNKFLLLVS
jgi:hypothetical protein